MTNPSLVDVPADHLTARLYELRRQERYLLVEFLQYLGEVDRRKLYLELGFSSLFAFLTDYLGLTRSSAFRRSTAARLLARFPDVAPYLADGRLCLTTVVELRDVLCEERLQEILTRAAGRTEDEVRALVAALRPRPEPSDLLRRLPPSAAVSDAAPTAPTSAGPAPPSATPGDPTPPAPARPAPRPLTPVSEERSVLRITVGRAFVADLKAAGAALSHKIPDGNLEQLLHECLRVTLVAYERRRRGSGRTRATTPRAPRGRYIPAVRDEVWRRDEARCTYVGSTARRCGSTHLLQVHHIVPAGRGGPATAANLTLRCAAHNQYEAVKDYGQEHMQRAVSTLVSRTPP